MASEALVVQAIYSFKGSKNDELCFKKGDLITVTQRDEGWWEGTLNGKTGWFPSNYVKEVVGVARATVLDPQIQHYKSVVLKDLIDSERAHVTELDRLVQNFLHPLEKSAILHCDEYKQLTGNLLQILEMHKELLLQLEAEEAKPSKEQRVGRMFLTKASAMKNVHQAYCAMHPKAVCILDKYREALNQYMESRGAACPGILVLTTLLSKPFRRLDKYSGMLLELERHLEESHSDRGDTQRSVVVMRDIANACASIRRQKELELQVLTGLVQGWEGPPINTLGDIVFMGSVALGPNQTDRYLVLFPQQLIILSVDHCSSSFSYEGRLPLSGLQIRRLEDNEHQQFAFEISTSMTEPKLIICQNAVEANNWVDLLTKHQSTVSPSSGRSFRTGHHSSYNPSHQSYSNTVSMRIGSPTSINMAGQSMGVMPISGATTTTLPTIASKWTAARCIRPSAPLRPHLATNLSGANGSCYTRSNQTPTTYKEDALILDAIEAYCSPVKSRNVANTVVEQGSINAPENVNSNTTVSSAAATTNTSISGGGSAAIKRSTGSVCTCEHVIDSMHMAKALKIVQNKLNILEYTVSTLAVQLNEEQRMRCSLQSIVQNFLIQLNGNEGATKDAWKIDAIEWPAMETGI